ncbi:hypothetical protein QBK99_05320 [Corticibacterium sp. UT-5YL-CI-8]|nr:hypothetical protein [Tianweitania sp. UT-5YL-CI-8]
MKNPFKRSTEQQIADQLGKFESGLDTLQRRRQIVDDLLTKAREKRRDFISENPGTEVPGEIRHAITIAELDAKSTGEEIEEYRTHITELQAALVVARERQAREAAAMELNEAAKRVDTLENDMRKAASALTSAAGSVLRVLDDYPDLVQARPWSFPEEHDRRAHDHFAGADLVGAVIAELLFRGVPEVFDRGQYDSSVTLRRMDAITAPVPSMRFDGLTPPAVEKPASVLISERLRARAAAIVAGELPLPAGAPPIEQQSAA